MLYTGFGFLFVFRFPFSICFKGGLGFYGWVGGSMGFFHIRTTQKKKKSCNYNVKTWFRRDCLSFSSSFVAVFFVWWARVMGWEWGEGVLVLPIRDRKSVV